MCTVVPYEYMSVSDVLNGLIYLTLSSPTRRGRDVKIRFSFTYVNLRKFTVNENRAT